MAGKQYGDNYDVQYLPDGSILIVTKEVLVTGDDLRFARSLPAVQQLGDNYDIQTLPNGDLLIVNTDTIEEGDVVEFYLDDEESSSSSESSESSSSSTDSESSYSSESSSSESSESSSSQELGTGEVVWGHDIAVTEFNIRDFTGNITDGSGYRVLGTGDNERVEFEEDGWIELETWNFGVMLCELLYDKYQSGSGSIIVRYKNGNSESNCEADSWNLYSTPFACTGWVKMRIEA